MGNLLRVLGLIPALAACSGSDSRSPHEAETDAVVDAFDVPLSKLPGDLISAFNDGDAAFGTPMRNADGLGPLYTRSSCDSCHSEGLRGPGLVQKMAIVEADGVTPASDQSELKWGHTVHPLTVMDGVTPIVVPSDSTSVKVTTRFGPPVLGRGYLEAIADEEIERVEKEQAARDDGIHGRINHVIYASEPGADPRFDSFEKGDAAIGRFGLKARVATLDDFAADAFQGDMGITSPLRPNEFANPDGVLDDAKPGIDVTEESVRSRAMYVRLLAIPTRHEVPATKGASATGEKLFADVKCAVCHVPSMKTRADYPVAKLAGIDAQVYTDMLLHAMGDGLADGLPISPDVDGEAGSFDWRTEPLIGLRFDTTYMHDGRAKTIEEAILAHRSSGSEANESVDRFDELSSADRSALIQFVESL